MIVFARSPWQFAEKRRERAKLFRSSHETSHHPQHHPHTSNKPERLGLERGGEYFIITDQSDGTRVVHAHCESDDALNVIRKFTSMQMPAGVMPTIRSISSMLT